MGYPSRERVRRILTHQEADRVPYDAVVTDDILAMVDAMELQPDHRAFCVNGDFCYVTFDGRTDKAQFMEYLPDLPNDADVSCWGVGSIPLKTTEGYLAGHTYFHPLKDVHAPEALDAYPFPKLDEPHRHLHLEEEIREAKKKEYTVVGQMSETLLETAYLMRGLEQLMLDFCERPAYVEVLFEKLAAQRRFQARRFAEAGVDVLRIGDDIATQQGLMLGPRMYRDHIKRLHASIVQAAREVRSDIQVLYHSDGNLTALLPDLLDIGVTAINPAQPECMDLRQVKREFGRDLTLWGCCPVQSVYANGSREDVLDHIRFVMENLAHDGGLVLQFTNLLVTDEVLENLRGFFESFYERGIYRHVPPSQRKGSSYGTVCLRQCAR